MFLNIIKVIYWKLTNNNYYQRGKSSQQDPVEDKDTHFYLFHSA